MAIGLRLGFIVRNALRGSFMSDQIIGFGWLSLTSINSGSESGAYGNIDKDLSENNESEN
jgi:hypothetical protein